LSQGHPEVAVSQRDPYHWVHPQYRPYYGLA
jgi:hypothetical protein